MKIAIMQPYFCPYIGYWQLINAVDIFVLYDNIQFEKQGWMRRNRILVNGQEKLFTIPIMKDSDYLDVRERRLSDDYLVEAEKILRMISASYKKAPFYETAYPVIEQCFLNRESKNLFEYIYQSIKKICSYLGIETKIIISSQIEMNHDLKNKYRVMEICHKLQADSYINPSGGVDLYSKEEFSEQGIKLQFLKAKLSSYQQFSKEFVPALSIIDLMMFLSKEELQKQLLEYDLL